MDIDLLHRADWATTIPMFSGPWIPRASDLIAPTIGRHAPRQLDPHGGGRLNVGKCKVVCRISHHKENVG